MAAVKATLDVAGLHCSEVEVDTSRQVFTGLQLDHEGGILPLEDSRIWSVCDMVWILLRAKSILLGTKVAKLIGHITWSCLLRRPALSCTFGPRMLGIVCGLRTCSGPRSGSRHCWPSVAQCNLASGSRHHGSMPLMTSGGKHGATESRVAGVTQWMWPRQGAVQNGGGFFFF